MSDFGGVKMTRLAYLVEYLVCEFGYFISKGEIFFREGVPTYLVIVVAYYLCYC